jgi:hypothetical protein
MSSTVIPCLRYRDARRRRGHRDHDQGRGLRRPWFLVSRPRGDLWNVGTYGPWHAQS